MDTDPAREEHGGERVFGLVGLDQKKEEMGKLLDEIEEQVNQRAIEIEEKAKLVTERLREIEERERKVALRENSIAVEKEKENESELKKKLVMEQRLREVEEREKKVGLLENSLKEKEREMEARNSVEYTVMRSVVEKMKEVEEKVKELDLLKQKKMELGEGSIQQGETSKKRSRAEDTLCSCSAKRNKHADYQDKEAESSSEEIVVEEVTIEPAVPTMCQVVEAEFNSFKKTINSFEVGQLWALYDRRVDNMPRLYGRIKGIVKSRSCIRVKWLNPKESVHVPVACGRFQPGRIGTRDYLAFSHEMERFGQCGRYTDVYPKKGEVWALFRDWNKNHHHPQLLNYDFVEILDDFDDRFGVVGFPLEKVDGFVSVFKFNHTGQEQQGQGLYTLEVAPDEMNRFSHKVAFFRLSGDEKEGVPVGSFELDPSALPSSMLKRREEPKMEGTKRQSEEEGVQVGAGTQNGTTIDVPIILD